MATKNVGERVTNPLAPEQNDYVPHGSERHLSMLGLRPAEKDEAVMVYEGYTLADPYVRGASGDGAVSDGDFEAEGAGVQDRPSHAAERRSAQAQLRSADVHAERR